MTNASGKSTQAVFGFIRSVLKVIKDFSPEYMVAVFDGPDNKKKRLEIYADYKSKRMHAPEDLLEQITWAEEFCAIYGIPKLKLSGVEADDAMGSVAKYLEKQGFLSFLCTGDKDLCQLVNEHIFVLQTHKDNMIVDSSKVEELYGVLPSQIVDYLAITGDASDNIPGLSGFGPKTAASLLKEFGSLDALLANPTQVSGKKKQEILMQEAETALLSRRLALIDTSLDLPEEDYRIKSVDTLGLAAFYEALNFKALRKELQVDAPKDAYQNDVSYELVDDEKSLNALVEKLASASEVAFDVETTDLDPIRADLVGVGFCIEPKKAWYVPLNGSLGKERALAAFKTIFKHKTGFYGHNVKYDFQVLCSYGVEPKKISFDTMLASYLLYSQSRQHSLEHLALHYLGHTKNPIKTLLHEGKEQLTMDLVPIQNVCSYCCLDVDLTCQLKMRLEEELKERKLLHLLYDLELPLLQILANMERHGIFVDVGVLQEMSKDLVQKITSLEKEIYEIAGVEFNLNSPKQLGSVLQDKLGLHLGKKTATGQVSTNVDVLEELARKEPIARKILEFRSIEKLRSTYVDALPLLINPKTRRVHCSFNQSVAATGRLSCQNPNLQNIPVRTPLGREIRRAFKPELDGWSYLSADYSQIELRLLAHLSEDPNLLHAFQNDEDIHSFTAALIFDKKVVDVTKEERSRAKTVNFGIIYGQQAYGLAKELGISVHEAAGFIEAYFARYKRVHEFLEECKKKARLSGRAVTITGRERDIPDIHSKNQLLRVQAERLAINTPIQGFAADLIKQAMLLVDARIRKGHKLSYMILQIHDELLFEVPDFELMDMEHIVRSSMQNVIKLKVPLKVDIAVGKNWKEC